jgi:DNA (cytosine-5)-methyltransferase 1
MTHVHGELTGVSLFDGIGGFPEAMRRNGVRTVATVEIDKQAAGVTADHFPDAQHFDDVTKVTIGALADLGYGFAYRVLDAQHFGVPQRRRRVVIVGCLGDWAAPAQVLLEPEGSAGNPAPGGETRSGAAGGADGFIAGAGVVNALTSNMAGGGGGVDDNTAQGGHLVAALSAAAHHGDHAGRESQLITARPLTAREGKGPDSDATSGNIIGFDLTQITSGENRSNQPHVAQTLRGEGVRDLTAEGSDASEDGTGRGTPIVAYALRADPGGVGQGHNTNFVPDLVDAVRRLTPVECERLQGYSDGWTATSNGKPQADAPRYRQLGNSIAVPVFEWVIRRLVAHEHS